MEQYPLLKSSSNKNHHWEKFKDNLGNLTLSSDSVLSLQNFWYHINTAFSTTLATDKGIKSYDKLTMFYNFKTLLLPNPTHPSYHQSETTFENLSNILHCKLLEDKTITREKSPNTYNLLQAHRLNPSGFDLLKHIDFGLSPQLGGQSHDAQQMLTGFSKNPDESISDFFVRTTEISNTITLLQDHMGQNNRVIGIFIESIYNMQGPFAMALHQIYAEWLTFRRDQTKITLKKFHTNCYRYIHYYKT